MNARLAAAAVVALALIPCTASAQQPEAPEGAPGALTKEYPLGQPLRQPTHAAAKGRAEPKPPSDDSGPPLWLFLVVPQGVAAALVALAVYARGGPPAAYGYAIDERPRPRREVSPDLLHAVRLLVEYDHRRDAYVLRVVGHRIGPVLWTDPPERSQPTGRFARRPQAGADVPLTRDREAR